MDYFDKMAERENERVANPFIGLQPTVFQRKKPLPPIIKKTITQPSRIPIRTVRTKKYHKLPDIGTNKKTDNTWLSTTNLSDDVMTTETMVTPSENIQTSCRNNHIAFVDLHRKPNDLNQSRIQSETCIANPLELDIDRDQGQTRQNSFMNNEENYHRIKRQKNEKQQVRSHTKINLSGKYADNSTIIKNQCKKLPQRPAAVDRLAGLQKTKCCHSNDGFVFEYSLLPRRTRKIIDPGEHTGIPCKPRLHKLHSGKYCEWQV